MTYPEWLAEHGLPANDDTLAEYAREMPISTKDWHELQDELDNIEGHAVYLIETGRIYQ